MRSPRVLIILLALILGMSGNIWGQEEIDCSVDKTIYIPKSDKYKQLKCKFAEGAYNINCKYIYVKPTKDIKVNYGGYKSHNADEYKFYQFSNWNDGWNGNTNMNKYAEIEIADFEDISIDFQLLRLYRQSRGNWQVWYWYPSNRDVWGIEPDFYEPGGDDITINLKFWDIIIEQYPNQATNKTDVKLSVENLEARYYNYRIIGFSDSYGWSSEKSKSYTGLPPGTYTAEIQDPDTQYVISKEFTVNAVTPPEPEKPLELKADITDASCKGDDGAIDISMDGFETYIQFDGNNTVTIGRFSYVDAREFTIEGRIRVNENDRTFKSRTFISLFGQDNTVEFGFINGKLSCYVATNVFQTTFYGTKEFPNDGEWHHVAVRGNGGKIELLVDGEVADSFNVTAYTRLKVDSGGANKIKMGDNVWGQSNEAFKGDIARVGFWNKYLTNEDIKDNLKLTESKWLSGEETGLIAAYNIDKKYEGNLYAVPTGKGYDGSMSNPSEQWQAWVQTYQWTSAEGHNIGFQATEQDLLHLVPGTYTVNINYGYKGEEKNTTGTFEVKQKRLTVKLTDENAECCEEATLTVGAEITGLVTLNGNPNQYLWTIDGNEISGTKEGFTLSGVTAGTKRLKLRVKSGVCDNTSEEIELTVHKNITTKRIRRK